MSTNYTVTSSRPTESVLPRPHTDASHRLRAHGKVQGMDYGDEHPLVIFSRRFAYFAMGFAGVIAIYHVARAIGDLNLWFVL